MYKLSNRDYWINEHIPQITQEMLEKQIKIPNVIEIELTFQRKVTVSSKIRVENER